MASPWDWPEELDALVAAPQFHTVLLENEAVRVLETRILPGIIVPLHTHRWPGVMYILSWSDFIRRDGDGAITLDTRVLANTNAATARWSQPLPPHTVENVGTAELRVISVEVKTSL